MKIIRQLSLLLLTVIIILGAFGCMIDLKENLGHDSEEYISAIEKALKYKYSLDFSVESIGGTYGTYDNDTVKAWCYCNEGECANIRFYAEIDKADLEKVKDSYLSVVAASVISNEFAAKNDARAVTVIESGSYSDMNEIGNYSDYLNDLNSYFVTMHMFVKDFQFKSNGEYAQQVMNIVQQAKNLNIKHFSITFWFVSELSDDVEKTFRETTIDKLYDEYLSKNYTLKCATVQIHGTEIQTDLESIISSLERE